VALSTSVPRPGRRLSSVSAGQGRTEPFADVARRRDAWILVGSTAETTTTSAPNTSVLIAPGGSIAAAYRRIHLFRRGGGGVVDTSPRVTAGDRLVTVDVDGRRSA
jgi:predicted amidohydrolase